MDIEFKTIQRRVNELDPLFIRMDASMDLYFLKPYIMKDFDNNPIPLIVNLTMNDAAVYAFRTIAYLQGASPKIVITASEEGKKMTDKETSYIESFCRDYLLTIDEHLGMRGIAGMHAFIVEQACIRGRVAAFSLNRPKINGKTRKPVIDVRPLDTRYTYYQEGMDGFQWGANARREARENIPEEFRSNIDENTSGVDLIEAYSKTKYKQFMKVGGLQYTPDSTTDDSKIVKNVANPYRYVPLVYQKVPAGSLSIAHPDAIAFEGEDIFALNRGLYPKLNELGSVLENLTMASFFGAKQYESEAGEAKKTKAIPFGLGVVVSIEKGGGYRLIPVADIRNATRLLYSMIETRLQRGSLPAIDYGNLTFPLSAVAIARLTEGKDQIFIPRLQCFALFYRFLLRMGIKQIIAMGMPVVLGAEGHQTEYDPAKLKGEYAIFVEYQTQSKEQRLAEITEAQALRGILSDDTIRRDTLHLDNPDGEADKLRDEAMERQDPIIAVYNRCHSLIEQGKFGKHGVPTEIALRTCEMMIRQRMMQQSMALPTKAQMKEAGAGGGQQPKQIMPLTESGRGGERSPKSEEREMEDEENLIDILGRRAETGRQGRPTTAMVAEAEEG